MPPPAQYTGSDVDCVARSLKTAQVGASQRASEITKQPCIHNINFFNEASFDQHVKQSLSSTEKSKGLLKLHGYTEDKLVNDWAVLLHPTGFKPSDPRDSFMPLDTKGWADLREKLFPSPSTRRRTKKRRTSSVIYKCIKLACLKHFGFGPAAYLTWFNKQKVCKTATTFLAFVESLFQVITTPQADYTNTRASTLPVY